MNILLPYLVRWNSLNRSRYYQIFTQLASQGHEIHIAQPPVMKSKDTGFIEGYTQPESNVFVHDVKINPIFWNKHLPFNKIIKKGYYCLKINTILDDLIRRYKIDAVVFYNMLLYPVTKHRKILSIYDLGDDHIDLLRNELGSVAHNALLWVADKLLRKTLKNSDLVFSVSSYLSQKYYPDSILLPNGVTIDGVHPGSGKEIKDQYTSPAIGFVGSLEYFINFDQIIQAASYLKEYTFVIAGGGREYEYLQEQKKQFSLDNLILTGGLQHTEILRYIDSFDICLNLFKKSPLTDGACPIKLFEYMAFKKPIISSRIQEVQNIDQGFIYWADSTDELVKVIENIFQNPDSVQIKVDKAYDILLEKFTWEKISEKFISVVEETIEKNNCRFTFT